MYMQNDNLYIDTVDCWLKFALPVLKIFMASYIFYFKMKKKFLAPIESEIILMYFKLHLHR